MGGEKPPCPEPKIDGGKKEDVEVPKPRMDWYNTLQTLTVLTGIVVIAGTLLGSFWLLATTLQSVTSGMIYNEEAHVRLESRKEHFETKF